MRHAELSRTSRALAPFPSSPSLSSARAFARARGAGAAAVVAAVGCNRRGENNVKARDSRRPSRRRTPEELAQDHEDALRWRAKLRAGAGSLTAERSPSATAPKERRGSERSRF